MHYAVHGHTAAELIIDRADAQKEHMGLTTWENAPDGKIVKPDVSVAKNYLKENELEAMGRIVNSFLDERSRLNTPKSLLKPNLKSIVSFKTACLSPTSTNWMTEICLHLILYQRIHNPNHKGCDGLVAPHSCALHLLHYHASSNGAASCHAELVEASVRLNEQVPPLRASVGMTGSSSNASISLTLLFIC